MFSAAAFFLIIIPGPAVLYIMAKSIDQGYKVGLVSVMGIGVGGLFHVLAAGIGVSAILVTSAAAFMLLKYLGALYLIYLGVKKLLEKTKPHRRPNFEKKQKLINVFYEGIVVNALNPKTAIFFLAFLPQFISIEKGSAAIQLVFLGLIFIVIATICDCFYALISGKAAERLRENSMFMKINKYLSGVVYIILGLMTLAINQPSDDGLVNTRK